MQAALRRKVVHMDMEEWARAREREQRRGRRERLFQTLAFAGALVVLILVASISFVVRGNRRAEERRLATATAVVERTATAWADLVPARLRTPVPSLFEPLTLDNVDQIVELARWGRGRVAAIDWSADGQYVAIGSPIGVYLYDAETRHENHELTVPSPAQSVALSANGALLVAGLADGTVWMWESETGREVGMLEGHTWDVTSLAFSHDGTLLASGSRDGIVRLWDISTVLVWGGAQARTAQILLGHQEGVTALAFSPDDELLASGSWDDTVRLWDVSSMPPRGTMVITERAEVVLRAESAPIGVSQDGVAFSPDGRTFAWGARNGPVLVYDVLALRQGNAAEPLLLEANCGGGLRFSPDGRTLAAGMQDGTVRLWAMEGEQPVQTWTAHVDMVTDLAFSSDGTRLLTGSRDNTVRLWDLPPASGSGGPVQLIALFEDYTDWVESLAFSPGSSMLAAGFQSGEVRLWDVLAGRQVRSWSDHSGAVNSVAFSPDGSLLASGAGDATVQLWAVPSPDSEGEGEQLPLAVWHHTAGVNGVAFSPDGAVLAVGLWDGTVQLWEVATGEPRATLAPQTENVNAVAYAPQGQPLASASWDGTIWLWALSDAARAGTLPTAAALTSTASPAEASWQVLRVLEGHSRIVSGMAFSPGGETLATASRDSTLVLWRVATGEELYRVETEAFQGLAFSPDGSLLASGSESGWIWLWDAATGEAVEVIGRHTGSVTGVAFSPDGTLLASAARDGTVRLWGIRWGAVEQ